MTEKRHIALVIDGQGGGIGAQLTKLLAGKMRPGWELVAVGTNAYATAAMLKAGAAQGATGENAVLYNAARAGIILGPVGVILANGIMGEVSPAMAAAVSGADAVKILIPTSTCGVYVAGTGQMRLEDQLRQAAEKALEVMEQ